MKILIPLDLSEVSFNAFNYANNKFPGASITVLHVVTALVNINYPLEIASGIPPESALFLELERKVKEELHTEEIPDRIHCEVYYGEPVNVISKYVKTHSVDCIVMGSRDHYNLFDKVFGTVSLGVIKSCAVPTFVIPKYAKFQKLQKIMVAIDDHSVNRETLLSLNYWNVNNAQVKFLHVQNNETTGFEKTKEQLIANYYEQYQPSFIYEIEQVESNQITESLLANAYNYNADLLITISRMSSFLEALLFKSLSKDLLAKSAIPMLFLHDNSKREN